MPPDEKDPSSNVGGDGKKPGSEGDANPAGNGAGGSGGDPGSGSGSGGGAADEKKFSQADVDAVAAKVRDEEKRKHDAKLKSERDETERKQREAQGEFQKLYEAEKLKTAELEAKATRADDYAKRINEVLDGEVKDWPAEVKRTDPGADKLDERLAWVETHRDLAKRLLAAGAAPNGEHGRQGRGVKPTDLTDNYLKSQYTRPGTA